MRLIIGTVGRIKPGPEASLVEEYRTRLNGIGRGVGLGPLEIEEIDARGRSRADESAQMLRRSEENDRIIALDERGDSLSSDDFSKLLCRWRDDGVRCTRLLIGGADGHTSALRKRADRLIAFGRATWPHMLVRAMLAEQLYRAAAIAANHPYHRGG